LTFLRALDILDVTIAGIAGAILSDDTPPATIVFQTLE
jgi:hypothetical protein